MVEENYNMKKIIFGITGLTLGGAEMGISRCCK